WEHASLSGDAALRAFREQLEHVAPMPRVPEWERIASRVAEAAEQASRGQVDVDQALRALDADVDRLLDKRRFLLGRRARAGGVRAGRAPAAPAARPARPGPSWPRPCSRCCCFSSCLCCCPSCSASPTSTSTRWATRATRAGWACATTWTCCATRSSGARC